MRGGNNTVLQAPLKAEFWLNTVSHGRTKRDIEGQRQAGKRQT